MSETYQGKTHDKRILDEYAIDISKNTIAFLDPCFNGYINTNEKLLMPAKKA